MQWWDRPIRKGQLHQHSPLALSQHYLGWLRALFAAHRGQGWGQNFNKGSAGFPACQAGSSPALSGPLPSPSKSFIRPSLGSLLQSLII